jgi:hypothetical protein
VVLGLSLLFLYEPMMVWRFGGTVGHRAMNLRVVADGTNTNPDFGRALVRFWIKGFLGLLSFFTMALTRRHQAVHDRATGTTVQMRDLSIASPSEYAFERELVERPGMPSKTRRVLVIVVYTLGSYAAIVVVGVIAAVALCGPADECIADDGLAANVAGLVWTGALAACIIFGWRGQLWGARAKRVTERDDAPTA